MRMQAGLHGESAPEQSGEARVRFSPAPQQPGVRSSERRLANDCRARTMIGYRRMPEGLQVPGSNPGGLTKGGLSSMVEQLSLHFLSPVQFVSMIVRRMPTGLHDLRAPGSSPGARPEGRV